MPIFQFLLSERNYAREEEPVTVRGVLQAASKNKYLFLYNISIPALKLTNAVVLMASLVVRYGPKQDVYSTVPMPC